MNKKKVVKQNKQVKLFLDPELLSKGFRIEDLIKELQLEVHALGISAGTMLFQKLVEAEAEQLVGERRYDRSVEYYPWGKQGGYGMWGGQKVRYEYPRVRRGRGKGEEVQLKSYEGLQENSDRTRRVFAQLLANVSCRQYGKAIETVESGYGISRSVVSREIKKATEEELERLSARSLADVDVLVLVIDGIEVDGTVFIAALGVDRQGVKHLLGFHEGGTENSDTCVALMEDLASRGLRTDQAVFAVLDGAKALRSAVKRFYGKRVMIQRCQEHKIRNVTSYLSKKYQKDVEHRLLAAYKMKTYSDALEAIQGILRYLDRLNESAAASLREGLEETLSVHRLELPDILRKSFSSTNIIESAYSRHRHITRNIKRWTNNKQKARWAATALLEAERGFRRIKGYRSLQVLVAALEGHMANFDENQKAA